MKKLESVRIELADGQTVIWSVAEDGLTNAAMTETNVLIINGPDEQPMAMYAPMFWLTVFSTYAEEPEVKPEPKTERRIMGIGRL